MQVFFSVLSGLKKKTAQNFVVAESDTVVVELAGYDPGIISGFAVYYDVALYTALKYEVDAVHAAGGKGGAVLVEKKFHAEAF